MEVDAHGQAAACIDSALDAWRAHSLFRIVDFRWRRR